MISIKLDNDAVMAGEVVTGRVFWSGDRARRIIVAAVWETVGEANKVRGVGRAMEHVPRGSEETFPFRLLIPHEGPITFKGELTGVVWKLKVRVDQPGFDEFEELELRVEPRRRPSAILG